MSMIQRILNSNFHAAQQAKATDKNADLKAVFAKAQAASAAASQRSASEESRKTGEVIREIVIRSDDEEDSKKAKEVSVKLVLELERSQEDVALEEKESEVAVQPDSPGTASANLAKQLNDLKSQFGQLNDQLGKASGLSSKLNELTEKFAQTLKQLYAQGGSQGGQRVLTVQNVDMALKIARLNSGISVQLGQGGSSSQSGAATNITKNLQGLSELISSTTTTRLSSRPQTALKQLNLLRDQVQSQIDSLTSQLNKVGSQLDLLA